MKTHFTQSKLSFFAILVVLIIGGIFCVYYRNIGSPQPQRTATKADIEKADSLVFSGDYQRVVDALSGVSFANAEQESEGRTALARSYYALKDYSRAQEQFLKVLSLAADSPTKSSIDNSLANSYRDSGDFSNARKYYAEAVENNPRNSQAWVNYAYMEYSQNNKSKANEIISSGLEALPLDASLQDASLRVKP